MGGACVRALLHNAELWNAFWPAIFGAAAGAFLASALGHRRRAEESHPLGSRPMPQAGFHVDAHAEGGLPMGWPFRLWQHQRNNEEPAMAITQPASYLADEVWTPSSPHAVVLSFLRSEWDRRDIPTATWDKRLITNPDLTSPVENNVRALLLWFVRGPLLQRIPSDTQWYEVKYLRERYFWQLHAINHVDWNSPADMNELEKVALRKQEHWRGSSAPWEPILWAHDKRGPFTILEGNHRLTALARSQDRANCELVAYVGLSPSRCDWHRLDPQPGLRV
jgi:hypothetical protein